MGESLEREREREKERERERERREMSTLVCFRLISLSHKPAKICVVSLLNVSLRSPKMQFVIFKDKDQIGRDGERERERERERQSSYPTL